MRDLMIMINLSGPCKSKSKNLQRRWRGMTEKLALLGKTARLAPSSKIKLKVVSKLSSLLSVTRENFKIMSLLKASRISFKRLLIR